MIHDLYALESYYGANAAALSVEDLIQKYGLKKVKHSLNQGWITLHKQPCHALYNPASVLCWLTDQGRQKAQS